MPSALAAPKLPEAEMLSGARAALARLFTRVGMPESHGLGHCLAVLGHMDTALACPALGPEVLGALVPDRRLALRLAALLHEADDHKYFPAGSTNARDILSEVGAGQQVAAEVEEMISYVSASANGNSVPDRAAADPSLLWPRWCDRLEAIGVSGAVRCWQYNEEKGDPLVLDSSPRPASEAELWAAVTPERWAAYQQGGSSASMMDHYYDKLLQIAVFRPEVVRCPALEAEAGRRVQPLVEICLEAGRTGQAPIGMIRALQKGEAAS